MRGERPRRHCKRANDWQGGESNEALEHKAVRGRGGGKEETRGENGEMAGRNEVSEMQLRRRERWSYKRNGRDYGGRRNRRRRNRKTTQRTITIKER